MDKFIAIQSSVDDVLTQQFEKLFRLIGHLNSRMITIKCISDAVVDIKLVFGYEGMRALETW